jgi:hypothetical protein
MVDLWDNGARRWSRIILSNGSVEESTIERHEGVENETPNGASVVFTLVATPRFARQTSSRVQRVFLCGAGLGGWI